MLTSLSLRVCTLGAFLTALVLTFGLMPTTLRVLKRLQMGQVVRSDGPKTHLQKTGTPTMGGVLVVFSILVSGGIWAHWKDPDVWVALGVLLGFSLIGWADDYLKKVRKNPKGLKSRWKYLWQSLVGGVASLILYHLSQGAPTVVLPFFPEVHWEIGIGFVLLAYFVLVGASNAVNLTDGLDGLVIVPVIFVALGLAVFAAMSHSPSWSQTVQVPYLPTQAADVLILCAATMGAGLGFLWFNTHPAAVFMGDVGALALGGFLGVLAIMLHQEICLVLLGGVFVIETLSVILQVGSYRLRGGKRIFKMAPIHHHFELCGWSETTVVVRFWILSGLLLLLSLLSL